MTTGGGLVNERTLCGPRLLMLCSACALSLTGGPSTAETGASVGRGVAAMGTRLDVQVVAADRPTALAASEAAIRAVEAVEARLSTWKTGTELDRLNRSGAGVWTRVSLELAEDIESAEFWWRQTDGFFDPGVASLIAAWDLRGAGRVPSAGDLERARLRAGFDHLEMANGRVRLAIDGFGIEEGGFGKGIALRDAAAAASAAGAKCVELNFGGQVLLRGACGERMIEVADPRDRGTSVAAIPLRSGSVATSGGSERFIEVNGVRMGHILDPVTGRPAPAWGSVTVVADDPVAADSCATALFVMGPERGLEWVRGRNDIEAVFAVVDEERVVVTLSDGLERNVIAHRGADDPILRVERPIDRQRS